MIKPVIAANIAATNTAADATSFTIFAFGWISGDTRSTSTSIAVLKSSAMITKVDTPPIQSHSCNDSSRYQPKQPTAIIATR